MILVTNAEKEELSQFLNSIIGYLHEYHGNEWDKDLPPIVKRFINIEELKKTYS